MTLVRSRPRLTLRSSDLSEIEAAKIDAFLRVGRHRFQCDWSIVPDGSCHVLVRGEPRTACPSAGMLHAAAILDVHDRRESQGPDALVRPLQYDAFVEALCALEAGLLRQAARHAAAAPAALPAPAPGVGVVPRRPLAIAPGSRLRLRRWPPAAMLHSHRYNLRLASFLSGRPLRLDELIQWSNVERAQCEEFLLALDKAGLLEATAAEDCAPPRPSTAPSRCSLPVEAGDGLLDRIRCRLGLGRPR